MKDIIFVDPQIIVEYLKTGKGVLPTAYEKYQMWVPATVLTEILASETFTDKNLKQEVLEFCEKYFSFKDVTKQISLDAAEIVRTAGTTLAKAILWASAMAEDLELLVDDEKEAKIAKAAGVKTLVL